MSVGSRALGALTLLAWGCGPCWSADEAPVVVPSAESSADTVGPPASPRIRPRIFSGAVDDIEIGEPIPKRYLDDKARYHARWVADAQPMEGFLIGTPAIWVTLRDGPMKDVDFGPIEELAPRLAPKAVAAARAGAVVAAILVEQPEILTEAGIGVGASYAQLSTAYDKIDIRRLPEWFDHHPTCSARSPELPGVRFLLRSCKPGDEPGPVVRVLVDGP